MEDCRSVNWLEISIADLRMIRSPGYLNFVKNLCSSAFSAVSRFDGLETKRFLDLVLLPRNQ